MMWQSSTGDKVHLHRLLLPVDVKIRPALSLNPAREWGFFLKGKPGQLFIKNNFPL